MARGRVWLRALIMQIKAVEGDFQGQLAEEEEMEMVKLEADKAPRPPSRRDLERKGRGSGLASWRGLKSKLAARVGKALPEMTAAATRQAQRLPHLPIASPLCGKFMRAMQVAASSCRVRAILCTMRSKVAQQPRY